MSAGATRAPEPGTGCRCSGARVRAGVGRTGVHPGERHTFQYTIDLSQQKANKSKVKPQRTSKAKSRARTQTKAKLGPKPTTPRAPVSPEERARRQHGYEESRNKRPERREYNRLRAQELRRSAKELGICVDCPNPAKTGETRCPTCAVAHRQSNRRSGGPETQKDDPAIVR